MADQKRGADWERIESDYRANILSLREIAARDGNVTEGAIRKRAKRDGWERNLEAKIKQKADALVRKDAVRNLGTQQSGLSTATEREVVEAGAQQIATVRLQHRTDIRRGRDLVIALLGELEGQTSQNDLLQDLAELMRKENTNGVDRLNDAYQKVISLPGRVDSVKKLSDALKNLIGLERDAYGLDRVVELAVDEDVDPVEGARRLAFILTRAAHTLDQQKGSGK